jgi:hypothetical protein
MLNAYEQNIFINNWFNLYITEFSFRNPHSLGFSFSLSHSQSSREMEVALWHHQASVWIKAREGDGDEILTISFRLKYSQRFKQTVVTSI